MAKRINNPLCVISPTYRQDRRATVIKEREALDHCWCNRRPDEQKRIVDYLTLSQLCKAKGD